MREPETNGGKMETADSAESYLREHALEQDAGGFSGDRRITAEQRELRDFYLSEFIGMIPWEILDRRAHEERAVYLQDRFYKEWKVQRPAVMRAQGTSSLDLFLVEEANLRDVYELAKRSLNRAQEQATGGATYWGMVKDVLGSAFRQDVQIKA